MLAGRSVPNLTMPKTLKNIGVITTETFLCMQCSQAKMQSSYMKENRMPSVVELNKCVGGSSIGSVVPV